MDVSFDTSGLYVQQICQERDEEEGEDLQQRLELQTGVNRTAALSPHRRIDPKRPIRSFKTINMTYNTLQKVHLSIQIRKKDFTCYEINTHE